MMKTCCILGCHKPHLAKNYCAAHYRRFKVHGNAIAGGKVRDGKPKAFYEMAGIYGGDDCLLWPYATNSDGYPCAVWGGKGRRIHRLICEDRHGPPPTAKHEAAHNCGNRKCVNPNHLRWATHLENMADTKLHGTAPSGERSGKTKLTWSIVRQIRSDFAWGVTQAQIARNYGLTFNTVHKIVHKQRWIE